MTTAVVTGIGGQDGQYLARELLANGYRVVGATSRARSLALPLLAPSLRDRVSLLEWDPADPMAASKLIETVKPHVVFHMAGITSGSTMDANPLAQADVNGMLGVRLANAVADAGVRLVLASSSEVFGSPTQAPQDESVPFAPRNAYGAAKAFATSMARVYRAKGAHVSSAILYNHESPLRQPHFVSRKVTIAVARARLGRTDTLELGDLASVRDWSHAADVADALRRMGEAAAPSEYVVGSGVARTVADLCECAFGSVGLDYRKFVRVSPELSRSPETGVRVAETKHLRAALGWRPRIPFDEMIMSMVVADMARFRNPSYTFNFEHSHAP
jgi:GDPmannose 4,6-dehydratase